MSTQSLPNTRSLRPRPRPRPPNTQSHYRTTKTSWTGRLLFDCGAVNTTDNDCEQQVPTVAVCLQQCLQQLTTPTVRRRSTRLTTVVCGL